MKNRELWVAVLMFAWNSGGCSSKYDFIGGAGGQAGSAAGATTSAGQETGRDPAAGSGGAAGGTSVGGGAGAMSGGGTGPGRPNSAGDAGSATSCAANEKKCGEDCVALDDPAHGCSADGCEPCSLPGALTAKCDLGACVVDTCLDNLADCDADIAGCEIDTSRAANCGACDVHCSGALGLCSKEAKGYACASSCKAAETVCGADCADLTQNPNHCSNCETACAGPVGGNGVAVCTSSKCGIDCASARHLCGSACKADTDSNACGAACVVCSPPLTAGSGTASCDAGKCGLSCAADHHLCGKDCRANDDAGACGPACTVCSSKAPVCAGDQCVCNGTVCGNTCADTNSDANNCGACGHSCLGGACNAGKCKAVTVATGQSQITHMVLDGSYVYFAVELGSGAVDAIRRAPLLGNAGKTAEDLTLKADNTNALALDNSTLYWANLGSTQNIMSIPKAGGTSVVFATSSSGSGIKVNGTTVFWTHGDSPNGSIERKVIASGVATTMASPVDGPSGLAIDASNIYYTVSGTAGSIQKLPIGASTGNPAPTGLAFDQYYPVRLFVDSANVYWMTSSTPGLVMKVPVGGGNATPLYTSTAFINDLVIDTTHAYLATGGSILRVPLAGGAVETVAANVSAGRGLAVDSTTVYFAAGSNVMRIAK